ncbi:hypothetical protein [Thalassomonas sp. RHCl1]|uniref:hypothetical protein n=1 Tax=Thalassomonas sp. RHCl1 TaxID=2995320 RepID=UPI00248B72A3|nr:hypothetical protein [Thalassomonas sp. RHCl1]
MEFIKVSSEKELEEKLIGSVFHVTPIVNMDSINESDGLKPNSDLSVKSKFGNTETGFFRLRDCVSFFDYREHGSRRWNKFAPKCRPTQIMNHTNGIAVLFLSQNLFSKLIPWTRWEDEEAYSQQIVPYIEIGYKGFVSLDFITKVVFFEPTHC